MNQYIQIAKVLRPHGIKGALKVESSLNIPLSKFNTVMVGEFYDLMHIERVQPLNQFFVLQISEIKSCEEAELYRNQGIYVDRDFYPSLFKDIVLPTDYIGCDVVDDNGEKIGVVVDSNNYGSAEVISINCGGTTYMVPFVEDTLRFDKIKKIFIVNMKRFLEIRV